MYALNLPEKLSLHVQVRYLGELQQTICSSGIPFHSKFPALRPGMAAGSALQQAQKVSSGRLQDEGEQHFFGAVSRGSVGSHNTDNGGDSARPEALGKLLPRRIIVQVWGSHHGRDRAATCDEQCRHDALSADRGRRPYRLD